MKAIKLNDNELDQIKAGDVINFKRIKEEYKTIFGQDALVIEFEDGNETIIIKEEYKIIE